VWGRLKERVITTREFEHSVEVHAHVRIAWFRANRGQPWSNVATFDRGQSTEIKRARRHTPRPPVALVAFGKAGPHLRTARACRGGRPRLPQGPAAGPSSRAEPSGTLGRAVSCLVSTGRRDAACPVSTGGGTRRVRLVREGERRGGVGAVRQCAPTQPRTKEQSADPPRWKSHKQRTRSGRSGHAAGVSRARAAAGRWEWGTG